MTRNEINRRKVIARAVIGSALDSIRKIPREEGMQEAIEDLTAFMVKHAGSSLKAGNSNRAVEGDDDGD